MRLAAVKSDLIARGILDERALMSYATLTGSVAGKTFQNIVAVCFQADHLLIFRANLDNSLGELLLRCRYQDLTEFILCPPLSLQLYILYLSRKLSPFLQL